MTAVLGLCRHPFPAMGSRCEVRVYAASEEEGAAINRVAAEGGTVEVDAETASLLDYADTCFEQSEGLFDLTAGALREAWGPQCTALPDALALERLLLRVGWDKLLWSHPRLEFGVRGMALDFGGVVKEYAADRAAVICIEAGVRHGLVDLGGDIRIIGPHPDGAPWSVGIQHPRTPDAVMATLDVSRGAVATSGDYERYLAIDGKRYCHILSPRTGMPVHGLAGVSVFAEECIVAGSATTIAMLMEERGPAWLEEVGLPHVWMDGD